MIAPDSVHRGAGWQSHDILRPRQQGLGGVSPILPVTVTPPPWVSETLAGPVPELSGYAAVDTGSAHSCVDVDVMAALGLEPCGSRRAKGMHSKQILPYPLYAATLRFPGSRVADLILADFVGVHLEWEADQEIPGKPIIVLLGRAALLGYTVIIDGPTSSITLIGRT